MRRIAQRPKETKDLESREISVKALAVKFWWEERRSGVRGDGANGKKINGERLGLIAG